MNIDLNNFFARAYIMTDYIFLEIVDRRNGEVYEFYKHKKNDKYYTFYQNYQEWSVYSITKKTVWKDREKNPFDFDIVKVAKQRPENPFEQFKEYYIKIKSNDDILMIKEIA